MTVPDCIMEFENLVDQVYSKPRFFNTLNVGMIDRSKYNAADLKELFEDVTRRRSEKVSTGKRILFPSKRGLCKTLVSLSFPYTSLIIQSSARDPRGRDARMLHNSISLKIISKQAMAYHLIDLLPQRKESLVSQVVKHCI